MLCTDQVPFGPSAERGWTIGQMESITATIERFGGLASVRELVNAGHRRDWIELAKYYERIRRVRNGWYSVGEPGLDVLAAWRTGGRLGCVSALAFYGVVARPRTLHVAVPGNAAKLRGSREAIIHWSRRDLGGDRSTVSLAAAVRQASRCSHVARDSL